MLLSRVADDIYWAARYLERAEDTARVVRAHAETVADLPGRTEAHWKPLITVVGSDAQYDERFGGDISEGVVVEYLLSDQLNPGSVVRCVSAARENLRTGERRSRSRAGRPSTTSTSTSTSSPTGAPTGGGNASSAMSSATAVASTASWRRR